MKMSRDSSPSLRLRIVLPFVLPTQNRLDSMSLRQRMKVKKFIRDTVSALAIAQKSPQTLQDDLIRRQWTDWLEAEYYSMIHPNTSSLEYLLKKSVKQVKQKQRSLRFGK